MVKTKGDVSCLLIDFDSCILSTNIDQEPSSTALASHRTLAITELVEAMLLTLSRNDLFQMLAVSHAFKAVIEGSILLQRKMLLADHTAHLPHNATNTIFSPLFKSVDPPFGRIPFYYNRAAPGTLLLYTNCAAASKVVEEVMRTLKDSKGSWKERKLLMTPRWFRVVFHVYESSNAYDIGQYTFQPGVTIEEIIDDLYEILVVQGLHQKDSKKPSLQGNKLLYTILKRQENAEGG